MRSKSKNASSSADKGRDLSSSINDSESHQQVSVVLNDQEKITSTYVGPSLVNFPDILPNKKTRFHLYSKKPGGGDDSNNNSEVSNILIGETNKLLFKSSVSTTNTSKKVNKNILNESKNCNYLLGIFKPKLQQLEVFPTTQFYEMRPIVKRLRKSKNSLSSPSKEKDDEDDKSKLKDNDDDDEGNSGWIDYRSSRNDLGITFGNLKTRRSIQAASRNKINPELMNHVEDHLTNSIAKNSVSIPSTKSGNSNEIDSEVRNYLPKFNREAKKPSKVYKLTDLVSSKELNSIRLSNILIRRANDLGNLDDDNHLQVCFLNFSKNLPFSQSKFINSRLKSLWTLSPDPLKRVLRSEQPGSYESDSSRKFNRYNDQSSDSDGDEDEEMEKNHVEEDQKIRRNLKILVYLNYLIHFKRNLKLKPTAPLNFKWIQSQLNCNFNSDNPQSLQPIIAGILNKFSESTQQQLPRSSSSNNNSNNSNNNNRHQNTRNLFTTFCSTKLLCFMAILCLIHDDYVCDFCDLADDLKEPLNTVKEIFRSVGCQITSSATGSKKRSLAIEEEMNEGSSSMKRRLLENDPSNKDQDAEGGIGDSTKGPCLAKLTVPLKFPAIAKKRQSYKKNVNSY